MEKTLKINGMSCMNCVKHVNEALSEIDGVTSVGVSLGDGSAVVAMSKDIDDSVFKAAIEDAGYEIAQ